MAKFASEKHKEENARLREENARLLTENKLLRDFATLTAKYMNAATTEERALYQLQIIRELVEAGYILP